ncbi:hypothetical protein AAJCM20276_36050 (plasmid) [Acetobacter aceti]|uniref:Glycosyl transferase family 2 n=1 Tax=Acetobacter aceti TaxID=435 RepID=A0A6S6PQM0_ACEAC|nr:glycosyltransferase family 2 protein [Acetobacter aceti]BCI68981.1 hypothetical protein AAJCM20276_36050 [Acetobacter aceti]
MNNILDSSINYKFYSSIICCARWEKNYIGEWLAYYHEIGFDHVYLICNDDDPSAFFQSVKATPVPENFYSLKFWPNKGEQYNMYIDTLQQARAETAWVAFFDVDEFLDVGFFSNIKNYIEFHANDIDCIYFNWLNYKTSNFRSRPYGSVLRQYVYRDKELNAHTKYLCRSVFLTDERIGKSTFPIHHGLSRSAWGELKIVNAVGDDWSDYVEDFPHQSHRILKAVDQAVLMAAPHIKHYHMRSEEDVILRCLRSTASNFIGQKNYLKDFLSSGNDFSKIDKGDVYDDRLKHFAEAKNLYFDPYYQNQKQLIIQARNEFWEGNIYLDFVTGRVKHIEHGTVGNFSYHDEVVFVYWDNYPIEIFIKENGIFKSVDLNSV